MSYINPYHGEGHHIYLHKNKKHTRIVHKELQRWIEHVKESIHVYVFYKFLTDWIHFFFL